MNKYSSLLLLAMLAVVLTDNVHQTFEEYTNERGYKFNTKEERAYRSQVYDANVKKIIAHNNDASSTYEQGINQFTMLTQAEFSQQMLTVKANNMKLPVAKPSAWNPTPIEYTLASKNITSVKDQAQCGSCWAFATIASIESLSYIANTTERDFSEQQLVSCSMGYNNQGCGGGWHYWSFNYILAYGLVNETDYTYTSGGGANGTCLTDNTTNQAVKISGYTNVTGGCSAVAAALLGRPLVVAVDATYWSPYRSGVFKCTTSSINHEVLLVGVNSSTWKIKNQWGTGWGVAGFMTINATGGFNACGICNYVSYPNK